MLSRLLWGARASLLAGVIPVTIAVAVSIPLGLLSGYAGGWVDGLIMRINDAMLAIPFLIVAIALAAFLGPSLTNAMIAIGIAALPTFLRLARGTVLAIKTEEYVEAAHAVGGSHLRIAFRHILPNTMGPFIVLCTAQLGSAILVEATLSFLTLGVPEPYPSWGRMLSVSAAEYAQKAPHLVLFPGAAISLVVFGSNLLGDALRDTLDPRLRGA